MIHCPRCGVENPPGSFFCKNCGTRLSMESGSGQPSGTPRPLGAKEKRFPIQSLKKFAPVLILFIVCLAFLFYIRNDPCENVICGRVTKGGYIWEQKCIEGTCVDYEVVGLAPTAPLVTTSSITTPPVTTPPVTTPPVTTPKAVILIKICNVNYDAPKDDNYNLNGEWVRICNTGNQDVNMSGWILYDEAYRKGTARDHIFRFPSGFVLRPGSSVTIHTGIGTQTSSELYFGRSAGDYAAIWNNDGDCAYLVDSKGNIVDTYCW